MCKAAEAASENALSTVPARIFRHGALTIGRVENGEVFISEHFLSTRARQAALAYHLVNLLMEEIQRAPLPASLEVVESILDSLSSIAEFPGVNRA